MSLSKRRLAAGVVMAVAIGIVNLDWLVLISDSRDAAQDQNMTLVKGFHLDTPEFKEAFTTGLLSLSSPRTVFSAGGARLWILVLVAFAISFLWFGPKLDSGALCSVV